ncbi:hypothetical protein ABE504_19365 [Paenibacillus oryzisoli]|uniref:hypothetical protein n=1 Tax=Paenibacillus oryzisoli TaxID=1850517 RepID=UPI003D2807EB
MKVFKKAAALLGSALLLTTLFAATASAAEEKRFDFKDGNYVTISNVVSTKKVEDVGYGDTEYVVQAPATVTFHGKLSEETQVARWDDLESVGLVDIKDGKALLTEAAEYGYGVFPVFEGQARGDNNPILLDVVEGGAAAPAEEVKAPESEAPAVSQAGPVAAAPTAAKVIVDGKAVAFEAYNIDGNNYFKLRDLAMAVNGTGKTFAVGWDAAKNAISVTAGQAYTAEGGELTASAELAARQATPTSAKVYVGGKEAAFTAYNIGGNNYFKLRDVAKAIDFGVTWNAEANAIGMDTKAGYTE